MNRKLPLQAGFAALIFLPVVSSATIIAANVNVTQNDIGNAATSVSANFGYSQGQISYTSGSRGDFGFRFDGATAADDLANGIMIVSMSENGRSNEGGTIGAGLGYSTPAIQVLGGGYGSSINVGSSAITGVTGGGEWNANHAVGYFKYSEFLGGWVNNTANNLEMSVFTSSSAGMTVGSGATNPGGLTVFDSTTTSGSYVLNLGGMTAPGSGLSATSQNGILLVVGGRNEDNYALSSANADGTFTLICKDNGDDGGGGENDGVGFVYIPVGQEGVAAMGRVDGDANVTVNSGDFTVTKGGNGQWFLTTPGYDDTTSTLLISPEGTDTTGTLRVDNIWSYKYDPVNHRWVIEGRDIPSAETSNPGLQNLPGEPAFSFALIGGAVPEPSSALLALGGGLALLRRRRI